MGNHENPKPFFFPADPPERHHPGVWEHSLPASLHLGISWSKQSRRFFFQLRPWKKEKFPHEKISGKDHLKTFCPFPLLCIDLASSRKPPRNSSHHLQLQALLTSQVFYELFPIIGLSASRGLIKPSNPANKRLLVRATSPVLCRLVEDGWKSMENAPDNRTTDISTQVQNGLGSISMLDGITLTTAELITLFDPDIWDQNTSTDDLSELPEIQG